MRYLTNLKSFKPVLCSVLIAWYISTDGHFLLESSNPLQCVIVCGGVLLVVLHDSFIFCNTLLQKLKSKIHQTFIEIPNTGVKKTLPLVSRFFKSKKGNCVNISASGQPTTKMYESENLLNVIQAKCSQHIENHKSVLLYWKPDLSNPSTHPGLAL